MVAPAFWFALLGLPGLIAYKAVNTADSMIGHRSARHEAFGWAAARFDDLLNLVPARLSGLLIALVQPDEIVCGAAQRCAAMRDCIARRMPAGRKARLPRRSASRWRGRAATAIASSTTRSSTRAAGRRLPDDIARALRVFLAACLLHAALYAALALVALTAARDREDALDIEMRLEMIGERVERLLDPLLVGEPRRDAENCASQARRNASAGEQPVHIGALHAAVAPTPRRRGGRRWSSSGRAQSGPSVRPRWIS